ncbi:MAG: hypothetical protein DDT20_00938 [Firmicutes bacterium]|nr:hypothetical protein [Bacillota bacterium]
MSEIPKDVRALLQALDPFLAIEERAAYSYGQVMQSDITRLREAARVIAAQLLDGGFEETKKVRDRSRNMTTQRQDMSFLLTVLSQTLLEDSIAWISNNLSPEDVFTTPQLESWARNNGWVEETK